ncbi:hypothetical protein [Acinetobacter sp. Marseille-Q1618]|uniref:hypothetical protein n=1 Tax=Acinetobacter sp. Marseille-Q1618 TaxID=2697502 RepID=UPI00156E0707|nr:hypothetical protein [Acinetobacter sp. Marseille-Q1618]
MNLLKLSTKLFLTVCIAMSISNIYATQQDPNAAEGAEVATGLCDASEMCEIIDSIAEDSNNSTNSCDGIENCTVVAASCNDSPNAAACNVDPEPTQQSNTVIKKYMQNGCEITEYGQDAVMDCSMKDSRK